MRRDYGAWGIITWVPRPEELNTRFEAGKRYLRFSGASLGKLEFEYFVLGTFHAQFFIRLPGTTVVSVHVEPKPGNVLGRQG